MKFKQWPIIVLTAVITALIVGGGVYFWQRQNVSPLADCSKLDATWAQFTDTKTSLSFCFKKSWGVTELKETGISPEARIGTEYHVTFFNSVNNSPLITYSTLDFQKTGDSDVPPVIDWQSLDFGKNDLELAGLFPDENATVQKLTVRGKQVLKVHRNFVEPLSGARITPVDYFMPKVKINGTTYNLHIICLPKQEKDVDTLLASLIF